MNPFTTALIKAPKRSRFDFSHSNTFGMRIGALTPTLCHQIFPGDDVTLSMEQISRLAPMPVPTFVNLKVRHDFFFVPLRLLYGIETMDKLFGAQAGGTLRMASQNLARFYTTFTPWNLEDADFTSIDEIIGVPGYPLPGSLFDYLGYPVLTDRNGGLNPGMLEDIAENDMPGALDNLSVSVQTVSASTPPINWERLIAYHFIWRDWYRFTGIDNDEIVEPYLSNGFLGACLNLGENEPVSSEYIDGFNVLAPFYNGKLNDMVFGQLGVIKNAHLVKDMFMSARYGNKPTVLIPTGANGTIPALREASAIQRFIDILTITGQRYFDKVKGLFGVEPEGPKDDRVQFLARYQQFIKVGEVLTTATTSEAETGDYAGRGILIDGKYLFKRHFTEHGYLFCISSVIPDVAYSGLSREITDVNVFDSPIPTMAQVGDQTIYRRELRFTFDNSQGNLNNVSFGDQFRYYAYKSHPSEVHGFFLMSTARPWSPLIPSAVSYESGEGTVQAPFRNVLDMSRVYPSSWNYIFNDTSDEFIFGDRFFFNVDFYEKITRALPKYINYHL